MNEHERGLRQFWDWGLNPTIGPRDSWTIHGSSSVVLFFWSGSLIRVCRSLAGQVCMVALGTGQLSDRGSSAAAMVPMTKTATLPVTILTSVVYVLCTWPVPF